MGKFEVDAFNCFQNKHFQEAGNPAPLVGEWETGSSLTLGSPQEVWSGSICGEVFSLHVYYGWQRWQRPIHWTRWLMHTLSHSNTGLRFLEPPEWEVVMQKACHWGFWMARAQTAHRFQLVRAVEEKLATLSGKTNNSRCFVCRSPWSNELRKTCLATYMSCISSSSIWDQTFYIFKKHTFLVEQLFTIIARCHPVLAAQRGTDVSTWIWGPGRQIPDVLRGQRKFFHLWRSWDVKIRGLMR